MLGNPAANASFDGVAKNKQAKKMNDKPFPEPILIKLESAGQRTVRSAWEGLEILGNWPGERDRHYRSAWRACRDALDGVAPAHRARRALRAAAAAARML